MMRQAGAPEAHRHGPVSSRAHARLGTLWPALLLIVLAVAFFGRAVFTGRVLLPLDVLLVMVPWKFQAHQFPWFHIAQNAMVDPIQQYYPWRHFAVESLRQGTIPLWNPHAFCGTPFVANLQSAVFYPPNVLFLLMPVGLGFTATVVLHCALAGLFMFGFLRALGLARAASLVGAVAFMFNGALVAWAEYPALGLWVMVWLPLILWLLERAIQKGSIATAAAAGCMVGVQFLGGHFQYSVYVLIGIAIFALWRVGGSRGERLRVLGYSALALGLGIAVAAAQVLPALELAARCQRPALSYADAIRSALPATHLATYLVPNFFGNPSDHNYWGHLAAGRAHEPGLFLETCGYVGILTLLLAFCGVGVRVRGRWLFATVAGFGLLAALGTPVYAILYYGVPGFNKLAGVARIVYLGAFGLAGLAAVGAHGLMGGAAPRLLGVNGRSASHNPPAGWRAGGLPYTWLALAAFTGVAGVLLAYGLVRFPREIAVVGRYETLQIAKFALFAVAAMALVGLRHFGLLRAGAFAGAAVALIACDLFAFGMRFNPVNPRSVEYFETPETQALQKNCGAERMVAVGADPLRDWMPPNTPMVYGLRDIQGSDSLFWGRYLRFLQAVEPTAPGPRWGRLDNPALDLMGVRGVLTTRELEGAGLRVAYDGKARVYERATALPRVTIPRRARAASDEEVLKAVRSRGLRPSEEALVARHPIPAVRRTESGIPFGFAQGRLRGVYPERRRRAQDDRKGVQGVTGAARDEPLPYTGRGAARIVSEGPNRVDVEARCDSVCVLRLADCAYPGWEVWVDGARERMLLCDYVFRGVRLTPGRHAVSFRYRPTSFRLGLFLSLLAVAAASGLLLNGRGTACRAPTDPHCHSERSEAG